MKVVLRKPFTQEELEFIRANVMAKTMKELARALRRSYSSVYNQATLVREPAPKPKIKLEKKKYNFIGQPVNLPIQRPPAQYSNKPTGLYYQP